MNVTIISAIVVLGFTPTLANAQSAKPAAFTARAKTDAKPVNVGAVNVGKDISIQAKSKKLKLDNNSIEKGMNESQRKADNLMQRASTEMWTGVGSTAPSRKSDAVQSRVSSQEKAIDSQKKQNKAAAAARDRKKAAGDSIQKMLDTIKRMDPQI